MHKSMISKKITADVCWPKLFFWSRQLDTTESVTCIKGTQTKIAHVLLGNTFVIGRPHTNVKAFKVSSHTESHLSIKKYVA